MAAIHESNKRSCHQRRQVSLSGPTPKTVGTPKTPITGVCPDDNTDWDEHAADTVLPTEFTQGISVIALYDTYNLLGGTPVDAPREVWWNFVSSSRERIEQAKRDWKEGRFESVPGDDEFIPLP